ncbi:MAG: hypothetical protein QG597_2935 [Actinomycetota bacterium]|nr:hypothetical protein [Actinomycetota bacterium]
MVASRYPKGSLLELQRNADFHQAGDLMDAYARGYRRAAMHLIAAGLLPAPCTDELQALWRESAEDRRLVAEITENWRTA